MCRMHNGLTREEQTRLPAFDPPTGVATREAVVNRYSPAPTPFSAAIDLIALRWARSVGRVAVA
jgi:hypothetical protein